MRKTALIPFLALLLALPAWAQDIPYPGGPPPAESFPAVPEPDIGLAGIDAFPVFQANERLTAAALNAAIAAPVIRGGSIDGAPIGITNAQAARFTSLNISSNVLQAGGTTVIAGPGAFQVGDNTAYKRAVFNSFYTPQAGVMQPSVLMQGNAFGTITSAANLAALRAFNINGDTINATAAQGGGLSANYFGHTISPGATGGRNTIFSFTNHTGSVTGTGKYLVGLGAFIQSVGSAGGTVGTKMGNLFGSNISSNLRAGSGLHFNQVVGLEINVGIDAGTEALDKVGLQIVQWSTDAVQAPRGDIGLLFAAQSAAQVAGWRHAIAFGADHGTWPMHPAGTLIGTGNQSKALTGRFPMVVARGIDFASTPVKFTTSALATPGFVVDGAGQLGLGSNTASWSSTGLSLGVAGKVGALSSIAAGGTGYRATDILVDQSGGVWEVATVSSGVITGLTLVKAPTITSGSAPSNPRTLNGGMGSGATINLTWTDANEVRVTAGRLRLHSVTVAGTGTTQGGAAPMPVADNYLLTASSGQTAIILPAATVGMRVRGKAAQANGATVLLFPAVGQNIRSGLTDLGVNNAYSIPAGYQMELHCFEAGTWNISWQN